MPIPLPNLDDRTYAELTAEARSLIPSIYPDWTNYNPSDPGIVLVELLAWLTEMLLYQVNEIPAANTDKFLKLLNGPNWIRSQDTSLDAATHQTIHDLRERYRAITPDDFEYLTINTWPQSQEARNLGSRGQIKRVRCVPQRNLTAADPAVRAAPAPAHVTVVIMPEPLAADDYPVPADELAVALYNFFDGRRALTTRHHIVGPNYVDIGIGASLALHEDALTAEAAVDALKQARAALAAYFHPMSGGPEHQGWPFGRAVYASEVYAVLEQVPAVNYVEDITLAGSHPLSDDDGLVIGIRLDAHELVKLQTPDLVAYDIYGHEYR
jgi:hypothetical protein